MTGAIFVLTGAGLSAESGLGTFREADGIWTRYPLEEVATPEGFARNPARVHAFYNERRAGAASAVPNAAHRALAQLQAAWPRPVTLLTQNVDTLLETAGAEDVVHMHGRLDRALCAACGHRWAAPERLSTDSTCPACTGRSCRPDVVWFGEMPYHLDLIEEWLETAELFVSIGTSGQVYPAAGLARQAAMQGTQTLALNLEPFDGQEVFDDLRFGPASEIVPDWVSELTGQ